MSLSQAVERSFTTPDGVKLFYRHWPPGAEPNAQAVILLHRGHEHSGRMAHAADELNLPSHHVFAWDARAHGRSGGTQDANTTMSTFVQDLDDWVRHLRGEFHLEERNINVVAQSLGAVFAAAWVHDYAPNIRALVLAAPAFRVKLYVPFARFFLGLWHKIAGDFFVMSYVKGQALTHDPERVASYAKDPLIKRPISVRVLLGLYRMAERLVDDAAAIQVPTQILLSGSDWVIHNKVPLTFLNRLGSSIKRTKTFPGFYHDILGEKDRHLPIAAVREFLLEDFPATPSLRDADRAGFTKSEYETLRRPAVPVRAAAFAVARLFLNSIGQLSGGIRLGARSGYDSGASLDYVYRNQATGFPVIGTLIDRIYLNSPGWAGIRVRKELIQQLLQRAAERLRSQHRPVNVIDIAAGHGRYIVDTLPKADRILLRDFDTNNVQQGQALAREKDIDVSFEQADAFCPTSYTSHRDHTLAVVSGLFELFPGNHEINIALNGLAKSMPQGALLLYTGQPWHPQLEFIARALTSHREGQPWIMRRRTQGELDELVSLAGFKKIEQRIDPEGLFTVSLAERQ
jgi:alpha-beta hydrolase superfamily lysophospholipase